MAKKKKVLPVELQILRTLIDNIEGGVDGAAMLHSDRPKHRALVVGAVTVVDTDSPGPLTLPMFAEVHLSPLLTKQAAADFVEVSARTIDRWRNSGLAFTQYNGTACVPLHLLVRFCEAVGHKPGQLRVGDNNYRTKDRE